MNKETKKKLSKKMNLKARLATVGLVGGLAAASLVGCNDVEAIKDPVEITSEVEDESIVSEEPTEEESIVSEEPEEEVVDYSAQAIIDRCNELAKKCPRFNADQLNAMVICTNYSHISDEDLEIILNTYGYDLEMLDNLYYEALSYLCYLRHNDIVSRSFSSEEVNEEALGIYRGEHIDFSLIILSENYLEYIPEVEKAYYDKVSYASGLIYNLYKNKSEEEWTNEEKFAFNVQVVSGGNMEAFEEKFVGNNFEIDSMVK